MNETKTIKYYLIRSKKHHSIYRGEYRDFVLVNTDLAKLKTNDPEGQWEIEERYRTYRPQESKKRDKADDDFDKY